MDCNNCLRSSRRVEWCWIWSWTHAWSWESLDFLTLMVLYLRLYVSRRENIFNHSFSSSFCSDLVSWQALLHSLDKSICFHTFGLDCSSSSDSMRFRFRRTSNCVEDKRRLLGTLLEKKKPPLGTEVSFPMLTLVVLFVSQPVMALLVGDAKWFSDFASCSNDEEGEMVLRPCHRAGACTVVDASLFGTNRPLFVEVPSRVSKSAGDRRDTCSCNGCIPWLLVEQLQWLAVWNSIGLRFWSFGWILPLKRPMSLFASWESKLNLSISFKSWFSLSVVRTTISEVCVEMESIVCSSRCKLFPVTNDIFHSLGREPKNWVPMNLHWI